MHQPVHASIVRRRSWEWGVIGKIGKNDLSIDLQDVQTSTSLPTTVGLVSVRRVDFLKIPDASEPRIGESRKASNVNVTLTWVCLIPHIIQRAIRGREHKVIDRTLRFQLTNGFIKLPMEHPSTPFERRTHSPSFSSSIFTTCSRSLPCSIIHRRIVPPIPPL